MRLAEVIEAVQGLGTEGHGCRAMTTTHDYHAAASLCLLPLALHRADLRPAGGELFINANGLTFIDHRGLSALAERARHWEATAVLRTNLLTAARIIKFLDLKDVQVEVPK